jgi:hypothetical protein
MAKPTKIQEIFGDSLPLSPFELLLFGLFLFPLFGLLPSLEIFYLLSLKLIDFFNRDLVLGKSLNFLIDEFNLNKESFEFFVIDVHI